MRNYESYGRSGQSPDFSPEGLKSSGATTNAASAADAVSVGSLYGELRSNAPKYDQIAGTAAKNRAQERIDQMNAGANMAQAGISAAANIEAAKEEAKAIKAQAAATEKAGMFSALGGIATAAIGLSDEDTKHTIEEIEYACDVLRELRPVTYFYKEEYTAHPERMHYGFIAQEYQKVMPDATYLSDNTGKLCIDTSELIGLLVRANQELQARITRLEVKNALAV